MSTYDGNVMRFGYLKSIRDNTCVSLLRNVMDSAVATATDVRQYFMHAYYTNLQVYLRKTCKRRMNLPVTLEMSASYHRKIKRTSNQKPILANTDPCRLYAILYSREFGSDSGNRCPAELNLPTPSFKSNTINGGKLR